MSDLFDIHVASSITEIGQTQWNRLANGQYFASYDWYLHPPTPYAGGHGFGHPIHGWRKRGDHELKTRLGFMMQSSRHVTRQCSPTLRRG